MKKYRGLIIDFLNEVVYRSHVFQREFLRPQRTAQSVWTDPADRFKSG